MNFENPHVKSSTAAINVLEAYGLLDSDDEQDVTVPGYGELVYERSEPQHYLSPSMEKKVFSEEMISQEQLGRHWASLLGLNGKTLKPDDNFFDLGGTSVEALKLGAITRNDGLLLAVPDIFKNPTLSEMSKATQIQDNELDSCSSEIAAFTLLGSGESIEVVFFEVERQCHLKVEMIEDIYPCTPLQKGLMAQSLIRPGIYLEQHVYTLPKSWNIFDFQAAWQITAESNPTLRTRIIQTEQCGWVQVVDKTATQWATAENLETYLREDKKNLMGFGDLLARCGLVHDAADDLARFVLTVHHSVQDGWSMNFLTKKINEAYESLGNIITQPKFNSFISYIEQLDSQASRSYWASELAGSNPSNFPRLSSKTYQPLATKRISRLLFLPKSLPSNITFSNLIRAAWSMIAARYVDDSDVTIGVTMSGRSVPVSGIGDIFGPTITTMPVRIRFHPDQTVREFLKAIQQQSIEMIPHEHYGLQNIQSINDDTCMACNFQNLLVVQPMPEQVTSTVDKDILCEVPMNFPNYLNYALTVECIPMPQGLKVEMGFDEAVLDEEQVGRVLRQFEHVLSQMHTSSSWEKGLNNIELISPTDKEEIMRWNSKSPTIQNSCVHHLIEDECLRNPNSPAICSWDGNATYAMLNDYATTLARLLVLKGVSPEVFVPVCFEKSFWTVIAVLGIMKAGGAFVLLNPSQPISRLKRIVSLVRANFGLASPSQSEILSSVMEDVMVIEPSIYKSFVRNERPLDVKVEPGNALYVTFTSGSTGEPKGSVTEHISCASAFQAQIKAKYFRRSSRVLQFASYSFDTSIEEILATLMAGGCICIPSEQERLVDLSGAINRMRVNLAELTTSAASLLAPESVPGLKVLRQGGEPMSAALINRWVGHLRLENSYGPSECCVTTSIHKVTPNADPTNIGTGLGCLLWIAEFSDYTRLAPIGTVGELIIQGPNVARGYINRESRGTPVFIEEPLLPYNLEKRSQRIFKTGDIARYNTDGTVSIFGRKDGQVKLRGQRIELNEVEHQLSTSDVVARSVVVMPKSGPFREELVAVMQLRDGPGNSNDPVLRNINNEDNPGLDDIVNDVREHLETNLPSYMVPTSWIVVNQIPSLLTGKSNRSAVSDWLGSMSSREKLSAQAAAFPSSIPTTLATDESIARILSSKLVDLVAGSDQGLRSSLEGKDVLFQSTGINSISIVTLASFIKQSFHVRVSIDLLTKSSLTVRQLAKYIENAKAGVFETEKPMKVDLVNELSNLQQSLLQVIENSGYQGSISNDEIETIFVTGATGYLGTYILRAALFHPQLRRVIALVRARTANHGLQRVIDSAKIAGWWAEELQHKLEVWIGDLGENHLGLNDLQWRELSGKSLTGKRVDAIIHNGAAVNWHKDYAALKPINVTSTLDLLSATACSPFIQKFAYISGGPQWDEREDDDSDEDLMKQIENSDGYGQTKIISELLTKYFARRSERDQKRISILKPGYIIGTVGEGISNTDDFLWRLVAGAVNIEAVSRDDTDSWIFVATVDSVANRALNSLLHKGNDSPVLLTKILDGLSVGELWSTMTTHFGYLLRPLPHDEWSLALKTDVDRLKQKHPLWPVMHLIDQGYSSLGSNISTRQRELNAVVKEHIRSAVVSNITYLTRIMFLPDAKGGKLASTAEATFNRGQSRT